MGIFPEILINRMGNWAAMVVSEEVFNDISFTPDSPIHNRSICIFGIAILDGRNSYRFNKTESNKIFVVSSAPIISYNGITKGGLVPALALMHGDIPNEISSDFSKSQPSIHNLEANKLGSVRSAVAGPSPQRLNVTAMPTRVKIASDVYVVPSSLGYSPAVDIITPNGELRFMYASAKSISEPLEEIRYRHGAIVDAKIEIRKESSDPKSKFIVTFLGFENHI